MQGDIKMFDQRSLDSASGGFVPTDASQEAAPQNFAAGAPYQHDATGFRATAYLGTPWASRARLSRRFCAVERSTWPTDHFFGSLHANAALSADSDRNWGSTTYEGLETFSAYGGYATTEVAEVWLHFGVLGCASSGRCAQRLAAACGVSVQARLFC
jgi:hypothetical protein